MSHPVEPDAGAPERDAPPPGAPAGPQALVGPQALAGPQAHAEPGAPAAGRLLELAVSDLALIERLRIPFAGGFNVLTGETGAGKSLLIDALGLALGVRADPGLVRHGAESARVEALFDRSPEPLVCVREVSAAGRSVARIDDETVTAARLASVSGPLVSIHGQHEQGRLLDERWQRDLLDAFGEHADARAAVAAAVGAWRANEVALARLAVDPREIERRIALVEHEASEIRDARLQPGEAGRIRARLDASRHGEAIARGAAALVALLAGEERDGEILPGARDRAAGAAGEAAVLGRLDPRFGPLGERLAGLAAELEDAAFEARSLAESVEHDPAMLAALEERLSMIYTLERKYGTDLDGLMARADEAEVEVSRLRDVGAERARRTREAVRLLMIVAETSAALSAIRSLAAEALASAVEAALGQLGLGATRVEIAVGRRAADPDEPAVELGGDAVAFDSSGVDSVVFRIAPNTGEPARPLARIASGGELSRVLLAVKRALMRTDPVPTYVFDEVDAGVGGAVAEAVGRLLAEVSHGRQVLCVTHLPQVAAFADRHLRVEKRVAGGRTAARVELLLGEEDRRGEVARMLAGQTVTGSALEHNAALIAAARSPAAARGRRSAPGRAAARTVAR
jgi:DNA repair protein RecN (Recombination protein N)